MIESIPPEIILGIGGSPFLIYILKKLSKNCNDISSIKVDIQWIKKKLDEQ